MAGMNEKKGGLMEEGIRRLGPELGEGQAAR